MIVIAGLVLGALWGGIKAYRLKGNGFDIAQYAVVHAMALGLAGLIITIVIEKMAG